MSLGKDCWLEGIVIHEMGHALSFTDEQNRPDRDNWLWIFWENIMPVRNVVRFYFNQKGTSTPYCADGT